MTLLLRDTDVRTGEAPAAPPPVARQCATCGAEMAPEQDWCLECGQAAPGRLGARPGMRTAATVVALTLLLAGGAVAASYAALQGDSTRKASQPAGSSGAPVAQAPPAVSPPAPDAPPPTTPAAPPAGAVPPTPRSSPPPATAAPPVPSSTPSTPSTSPSTTPAPPKKLEQPPAPAGPEPIDLQADSVEVYDPYGRVTAQGDPVDAYDGDTTTAWNVTVPGDGKQMAVGLSIDLGGKRTLDSLELTTGTPGFRAEVYATDSKELPPDVLDTRWAHLRDASKVKKGKTTISLGAGKVKYRHVLVWFTTPPAKGPTVRIAELSVLG